MVASVDVTVDRTLGAFLATPASFSPNGDGINDTMTMSFQLTQSATGAGRDPARGRERGHGVRGAAPAGHPDDRLGRHRASARACRTATTSRS